MKTLINSLLCFLVFATAQAQHIKVESGATIKLDSGAIIFLDNTNLNNSGKVQLRHGASLIQNSASPSNSGTGTYIVEKTGTDYERQYNYWASPVVGLTRNDVFSAASTSLSYYFDDPNQTWTWMATSAALNAGAGFIMTGSGNTAGTTQTRSFSGTSGFHSGNVNFALHYDDDGGSNSNTENDWNLIGNPYPSGIAVSQFLADNSAVLDNAIYIWNSDGNDNDATDADYATMNAAGVTGAGGGIMPTSNNIASCQGFFVRAIASGNATFQNSQRVGINNTFMRTNTENWHRIWLSATHENGYGNELLLAFIPDANDGKDHYDAIKLSGSQHLSFYSHQPILGNDIPLKKANKYAIQGLGALDEGKVIPLGLEVKTAGTYTFDISHLDHFPTTDYTVLLKDNELGLLTDLSEEPYQVVLEEKNHIGRFQLQFVPNRVTSLGGELNQAKLAIYSHQKNVYLNLIESPNGATTVIVHDILGRSYFKQSLQLHKGRTEIPLNNLATGIYLVTAINEWGRESKRVMLVK